MIYKIIGVFDALIERAMPLQCVNDMPDEDIIESHRRAIITKKIPVDLAINYVLYKYGTFDDETGVVVLEKNPVKLVSLADFCPKKVNKEVSEDVNANNA